MVTTNPPGPKQRELAFIVSNSLDKPDPNARQLIRSHVMRRRNRRKPADEPKLRSWVINQENSQPSQFTSATGADVYFPLPARIGTDWPVVKFAYDMPPYALDLAYRYFSVVLRSMYPIELCPMFDLKSSVWIQYLSVDALYCHAVLWLTRAYFDWLGDSGPSYTQIQHAQRTLVLLQQRLADSRLSTSDTTICVVVSMTMMTAFMGDHEAAKRHMTGLYKMVELRGGITTFADHGLLQVKICRADLTMALLTDSKPTFFSGSITWEPYIAKAENSSPGPLPKQFTTLDLRVRGIWVDLREFIRSANLAIQTGHKIDCFLFQDILISIQYRIQLLDVSVETLARAVHVGMLAFSTDVFLQLRGLEMGFENLSAQLRDSIFRLQDLKDDSLLDFKLWLLFVARMFNVKDDQASWIMPELKKTLEASSLTTWKYVRNRLKNYLWIDELHDSGGRETFEISTASSPRLERTKLSTF